MVYLAAPGTFGQVIFVLLRLLEILILGGAVACDGIHDMGGISAGAMYAFVLSLVDIPSRFWMSDFMLQWMCPAQLRPILRLRVSWFMISDAGLPGSVVDMMRSTASPGQTGRMLADAALWPRHQYRSLVYD